MDPLTVKVASGGKRLTRSPSISKTLDAGSALRIAYCAVAVLTPSPVAGGSLRELSEKNLRSITEVTEPNTVKDWIASQVTPLSTTVSPIRAGQMGSSVR